MGPGSAARRGPSLNVRLQHIGRAALRPGHEALRDCLLSNCLSALRQKNIGPCFGFGPGGRPHSSLFRLPLVEGDGAPTRRTAWIARPEVARLAAGPGRETSRPAPCGAPTRHLRLTPQSAIGPHQELCVPGGFLPRPPVGQACVCACPQVPLPIPALRTPPEGALDFGSGWVQHNYAISEVNSYFAHGE